MPLRLVTRMIALVIALTRILLTGLVAVLGVRALQEAMESHGYRR